MVPVVLTVEAPSQRIAESEVRRIAAENFSTAPKDVRLLTMELMGKKCG